MNTHNIICFEADWLYSKSHKRDERFNLKTEPMLEWLKEYHGCDIIHRYILNRSNLEYYMDFFAPCRQGFRKYDIVYFACHGGSHAISLEGEDGDIDLDDLATISKESGGFFNERIVHFSSCKTLSNREAAKQFKNLTGARLVCGYSKTVDAMKSAIADMALFNCLMNLKNVAPITHKDRSLFWKTYKPLLEELGFVAY